MNDNPQVVDQTLTNSYEKAQAEIQAQRKALAQDDLRFRREELNLTRLGIARGMKDYSGLMIEEKMAFDFLRSAAGENFTAKSSYDVNAHRLGYGSDTVTMKDGSYYRVKPNMTVDREMATRDLVRRISTEFSPRARHNIGKAEWDKLEPRVKAMMISMAYQHGSVPKELRAIVRRGDTKEIAEAVRNYGSRKVRRGNEADFMLNKILKDVFPAASGGKNG